MDDLFLFAIRFITQESHYSTTLISFSQPVITASCLHYLSTLAPLPKILIRTKIPSPSNHNFVCLPNGRFCGRWYVSKLLEVEISCSLWRSLYCPAFHFIFHRQTHHKHQGSFGHGGKMWNLLRTTRTLGFLSYWRWIENLAQYLPTSKFKAFYCYRHSFPFSCPRFVYLLLVTFRYGFHFAWQ